MARLPPGHDLRMKYRLSRARAEGTEKGEDISVWQGSPILPLLFHQKVSAKYEAELRLLARETALSPGPAGPGRRGD